MRDSARGLANASTLKRFKDWMKKNCVSQDRLNDIDFEAEFGKDPTYNEAVEIAFHKLPTLWKAEYLKEYENKPKQIIFIRDLVQKMMEGKIRATYRKSPKIGTYYVIENRFK
jgi:hypothetical protein